MCHDFVLGHLTSS